MSSQPHQEDTHHDDEVHISPHSTYLWVFAALVVLTIVTVLTAARHLGPFNDVVALGIALTKASLVVLFFMHVKYSSRLIKLIVVGSMAWLTIMIGLTMLDYTSRELVSVDPQDVPNPYERFEVVTPAAAAHHE
jgi:cytochrome c oxidase subunit 4